MMRNKATLPALLLALTAGLAGCGNDTPETEPREKNFGAGLGESYNQMLDSARQGVDAANRQMQETDERARDAR